MDINKLYKSVLDQDKAPIVICDLQHTIVYMNSSAIEHYKKRGGAALVGTNLLNCHNESSQKLINSVVGYFSSDEGNNIVHTYFNKSEYKDVYMIALRDEDNHLIGYYEKHEYRNPDDSPLYDI